MYRTIYVCSNWVYGKLFLQTDDGRKITRNYNKMASVLLEYEASFLFQVIGLFKPCVYNFVSVIVFLSLKMFSFKLHLPSIYQQERQRSVTCKKRATIFLLRHVWNYATSMDTILL